jgi:hypothetical protein
VNDNEFASFEGTGVEINLQPESDSSPSSFSLTAMNNRFLALETGIETNVYVSGDQNYTHTANIHGNDFVNNERDDYELHIRGDLPEDGGNLNVNVAMSDNHSAFGDNFADIEIGGGTSFPNGSVNISILDNEIEYAYDDVIDIDVYSGPDVNLTISRNEINHVYDDGDADAIEVDIRYSDYGSRHNLTITDNVLNDIDDDAIDVNVYESSLTTLTIANNVISGTGDKGIEVEFDYVESDDGGTNNININGNTLIAIEDEAIWVDLYESDATSLTIANNDIQYVGDEGIQVNFYEVGNYEGAGRNTISITGNTLVDVYDDDGIEVDARQTSNIALTIADNDLRFIGGEDNSDDGIDVFFYDVGRSDSTGTNTVNIDRNIVHQVGCCGAGGNGIRFDADYGDEIALSISDNDISFITDGDGIDVSLYWVGHPEDGGNTIDIQRNNLELVADNGIDVYAGYGIDTALTISDNNLLDVGFGPSDDGIQVNIHEVGHDTGNTVRIERNTIDRIETNPDFEFGDDGIDVFLSYLDSEEEQTNLTIAHNNITNAVDNGIEIDLHETDYGVVTVEHNVVENTLDHNGIEINFSYADDNQVTVANNRIDVSGEHGIEIDLEDYSDGNLVTINGNDITLSDENGIDIWIDDGSEFNTLSISANHITYGEDGIQIDSDDSYDTYLDSTSSNTVTYYDDDALDVDGNFDGQLIVNGYTYEFP